MNIERTSFNSDTPTYLNFEFDNNTYAIMDLEDRDYSNSVSPKTDLTKERKMLISVALAFGIVSSPIYASSEKEVFDTFEKSSFLSSQVLEYEQSNNYSLKIDKWTEEFILNAKNLVSPEDLFPYYSKINDLMINEDFEKYDSVLNKVEVEELNEVLIIALLRLSFSWKDKISSWNTFLGKSIIALEKKGHKSQELLVGLI